MAVAAPAPPPTAPAPPAQTPAGTVQIAGTPQPGATPSPEPLSQPPKGHPMDELFKRMDKLAGVTTDEPATPPPVTPKKDEPTEPTEPDPTKTNEPTPGEQEPAAPAAAQPKGKVNPWKLLDEQKQTRAKLEAEVVELRRLVPNQKERELEVQKFNEVEAQNKQLLEHIRYLDFQKHPEFTEKYERPYTESWQRIMRRLSGVTIQDGESRRAVEPKDIAEISRLPADQAIELSEQKFGKLGPWVAERVEELRQLDESRYQALETAKKEGLAYQTKMSEEAQLHDQKINEFLADTWKKAVADIESHSVYSEYFKPRPGDDEFTAKLESGTSKVDKFWGMSPKNPDLTPEQRAEVVRGHAAIRNRARAFGVLQLTIQRQRTELDRMKQELEQFKQSVPKADGSQPAPANGASHDPWAAMEQRLSGYAK